MGFPTVGQWELENLLAGAILGVLLMMFAEQRANHIQEHGLLWRVHLLVIYAVGMVFIVRLFISLLGVS